MGKKGKFEFDAGDFLAYIISKFKILLIISFAAAVIAAVCSLFLTNMFKSQANLVPTSQTNVPRSLIDINYGYSKGDLMSVGEEEEVDLLLQVLHSGDIFSRLVAKFDLAKHYKIDMSANAPYKKLYGRFDKNVKFSRTEYNTVAVEVWDEDPKFAYAMTKEIISLVDTIFDKMQRARIEESMTVVKAEYDSMKLYTNRLQDSLVVLGKLGVIDAQFQSKELTKAYYQALMAGNTGVANKVQAQLKLLGLHGSKVNTLNDQIEKYNQNLADLELKLSISRAAIRQNITHIYVANWPSVSDYKDYPKRSIIVLIAALAAFFTALFAFIIADNIKKLK